VRPPRSGLVGSPGYGEAIADSTEFWCDLHLHSTNSDGLASPEEVICLAGQVPLWAMCISDHSRPTFDSRLRDLASRLGLVLLPGVEISTTHRARKYHVLAYGRGVLDAAFQEFAFHPTAVKNATYRRVLAELRAQGARLPSDDDILAGIRPDAPPRHPDKWMFSSTLIAHYLAPAVGTDLTSATTLVKTRYNALKDREPDRYVPTEHTIALTREVGAIPVIAHPFWECGSGCNTWDGVVADLHAFAARGLVGVEVSSRHDSPADEERRRDVAHRLALVPFRSSDFHANGKTSVGQFPMPAEDLLEAAARCGVDIPRPVRPPPGAATRAATRGAPRAEGDGRG
jgi:predicted metal-dependent phosphoesterase TrpH